MKQWYYAGLGLLELSIVVIYLIYGEITCPCVISLLLLSITIEPGIYLVYSIYITYKTSETGKNLIQSLLICPLLYMLLLFSSIIKLDLPKHNILNWVSFTPYRNWWVYSIITHVLFSTCLSISGVALSSIERHNTTLNISTLCITCWCFLSYGYSIYRAMIDSASNLVSKVELLP